MTNRGSIPEGPAEGLAGLTLLGVWRVERRLNRDSGATGQSRSCCYQARNDTGEAAFVKAFDFRHEERFGDINHLEYMVREYTHELRVLEHCKSNRLSRVTRIYGNGRIEVRGETVHFLICEYAPHGSLRDRQPPGDRSVNVGQRLIALRSVAAGLAQLHGSGVAHQDMKPSNAVFCEDFDLKVADLGSSSCLHLPAPPHDEEYLVGQPGYAPYELLYNDPAGTWYRRRIGCDIYLLGNLAFTSFVGASVTSLVLHALGPHLRHTTFTGRYEDVLPILIENHFLLVPQILREVVPLEIAEELIELILSMCHPDPEQRGHPKNRAMNDDQYGLDRYISSFNTLASKADCISRAKAKV